MSNWQVWVDVTINVDDCEDGEEAMQRVKKCLPHCKVNSIKAMKIIDVVPRKVIQRQRVEKG